MKEVLWCCIGRGAHVREKTYLVVIEDASVWPEKQDETSNLMRWQQSWLMIRGQGTLGARSASWRRPRYRPEKASRVAEGLQRPAVREGRVC